MRKNCQTKKATSALKIVMVFAVILFLQACKHPLAIIGHGDIVDLNGSGHGCSFVEFAFGSTSCIENEVVGSYDVVYQAIPKPGWKFVRWDGPCGPDSRQPLCRIEVTSDQLGWWEANHSDVEIPATVAVFEKVIAELTEAESTAIEMLRMHMKGRNNRSALKLAAANNYPHYRMRDDGGLEIYEAPEDYFNFEERIAIPFLVATGWDHSQWDIIEVIQSNTQKVHIKAQFSRLDAEGKKYLTSDTFWIVTKQDGDWGIKFRSSFVDNSIIPN